MFSVEELELALLAAFWNVRYVRDRLPDQMVKDTCPITGLPMSANDLKPIHRAETGDGLAMSWTPIPSDLAASMIRYDSGNGEYRDLNLKPKAEWTQEEVDIHMTLTHRLKTAAHKLGAQGFLNLQPLDMDENPQPFGDDGMTARIQITSRGLEEAKKRVRGTPFENWRRGWAQAITPSELAKTPEWFQAQQRHDVTSVEI